MIETLKEHLNIEYHLNDLDERHLFIASHNLKSTELDKSVLDKVKFTPGDIVAGLPTLEKYDAILVARVLHFFSPEQLEKAITNIKNLLNPGGSVYIVAITPYVSRYKSFIAEYENRVRAQEEFPGYVISLKDWVDKESTTASQLANISQDPFMFLDKPVLTRLFEKYGFKITKCETACLGYESEAWSYDGRENVILIAEKK